MTLLRPLLTALVSALICALPASAAEDGLKVRLQSADAERFATLFRAGRLDATSLQQGYLDGAGRGVVIFTPHRIVGAERLARAVAARQADYAHAIATCLPLVDSLNAELRAVYLAYQGLLPELPLPAVHLVFGAGNSGGTAAPGAQVIGLEVMCKSGTTAAQFRQAMRSIFAHETAHTWQQHSGTPADPLLHAAFAEGVPELLARLVTGLEPSSEREAYGRGREAEIWARFQADREIARGGDAVAAQAAMRRWFANAGSVPAGLPEGWPGELGYWVGLQIAAAYVSQAPEPRAALRELLRAAEPEQLLRASRYAPR
jgi:hypothetical protein